MASNGTRAAALGQTTGTDQPARDKVDETKAIDQALALWRLAVEQCGWTYEALSEAMGKDKAYIHRVLNGEKPMSLEFQKALPDEIERRYYELSAKALGSFATSPAPTQEEAVERVISGLVKLLVPQLPARADRMAACYPEPKPAKASLG